MKKVKLQFMSHARSYRRERLSFAIVIPAEHKLPEATPLIDIEFTPESCRNIGTILRSRPNANYLSAS